MDVGLHGNGGENDRDERPLPWLATARMRDLNQDALLATLSWTLKAWTTRKGCTSRFAGGMDAKAGADGNRRQRGIVHAYGSTPTV